MDRYTADGPAGRPVMCGPGSADDPEARGVVERTNGFLRGSFLPGQPTSTTNWACRRRTSGSCGAPAPPPAEIFTADAVAMGVLPPVAPRTAFHDH